MPASLSGCCSSGRDFAPHFLQMVPRGSTLVLHSCFTSIRLHRGLVRDRKLVINEVEAETVRHIFCSYLELIQAGVAASTTKWANREAPERPE